MQDISLRNTATPGLDVFNVLNIWVRDVPRHLWMVKRKYFIAFQEFKLHVTMQTSY
jgi:hypothetical protein